MAEIVPAPINDLDALFYLTDCMLATVEEYAERQTVSARTFDRHIEIAEKSIGHIKERIKFLMEKPERSVPAIPKNAPWYHGYRYFNNTRVETVCSDFNYRVRGWIEYLRRPK